MTYYVEDRFKNKIFNTTFAQMEQLVASLGWDGDQHHPEVTLCHMSGWCIAVYPSGVAILTLRGSKNEPWHMRCNSYEHVLELWTLLAAGQLDELGASGWLPGYGA